MALTGYNGLKFVIKHASYQGGREMSGIIGKKGKTGEGWRATAPERRGNTEDNHDAGQDCDHDDASFRVRKESRNDKDRRGI